MEINIGDTNDKFFRYKRSPVKCQIMGGWTQVDNLDIVAGEIGRDVDELWKYIALTLNTTITPKKNRITGKFTADKVDQVVSDFVSAFVSCVSCSNPETKFGYKSGSLVATCAACGKENKVTGNEKMCKYLVGKYKK